MKRKNEKQMKRETQFIYFKVANAFLHINYWSKLTAVAPIFGPFDSKKKERKKEGKERIINCVGFGWYWMNWNFCDWWRKRIVFEMSFVDEMECRICATK